MSALFKILSLQSRNAIHGEAKGLMMNEERGFVNIPEDDIFFYSWGPFKTGVGSNLEKHRSIQRKTRQL